MIKIKDIQKYIIERNLKEIEAELVEIKEDSIVVKNNVKEVEIKADISSIHYFSEQLDFIKEAFKKLNDLSYVINKSGEFEHSFEDLDADNIDFSMWGSERSKEEFELIHGALYGILDFEIKVFNYDDYTMFFEDILDEVEYEELVEKEIEKLKAKIKEELEKIDKDNRIFVVINKERNIYENSICVSESYEDKQIRFYYFDDYYDEEDLKELEDVEEVISFKDITLYHTKATREEVKKVAKLIEDIVKKHKDEVYKRICNGKN